jgi:RNA polymerase sigma-70 factor (ECF subfamily)
VFILRHYHGLSYEEISNIVQCSLGTVKSRLHYAVRHLQQALAAG